jgi:lipopolysaccharide/colanic/teichoic acid biosynthesis glycosyltransferase
MSILLSIAFLWQQYYSRSVLFYFGSLLLVGFVGIRCLMRSYVLSRSRNGAQQRVVILGNGRIARELAIKIARHPELMKSVVGFLYGSTDLPTGSPQHDVPASATPSTNTLGVIDLLKQQEVEEIIVAHPKASISELQKLIRSCRAAGLKVSLVPQGYELYLSMARFLDVEGLPMLSLEERTPNPVLVALKRVTDVIFASALTLLISPILLGSAAALIFGGQKPFRRELRCGLNGKMFHMWRVNINRDASDLVGLRRWFARLSLTELPQLWNVICGDMSLVGPRPEPFDRVKHYSEWQGQRLSVKPGLTGLAQVHGLREQHASEDKARFDLQYILHWSPFLDLSLLLQTIWTVTIRIWSPAEKSVPVLQRKSVGILTEVVDANRTHAGAD